MIDLKAFRKANHLTQIELANYFGVGQGFISQIEKGDRPIPPEYISRISANPNGWDVSMLKSDQPENPMGEQPVLMAEHIAQLSNTEILLRDLLAEERARNEALNEVIWELKKENGKLMALLNSERKGGTAASANSSSVADAV